MAKSKGFTLIETLISLSIFVIIMLLIWGWQKDMFSLNTLLTKRITTQDDLRKTIKNFIAEVRAAQPSAGGASIIEKADKNEFIFFSDIDYDQIVERVRYFLNNHKLKKGLIKPEQLPDYFYGYDPNDESIIDLVNYVINEDDEIFFYYDKNYDGTSPALIQPVNLPDIRLVQITVTVNENPDRPPEAITETSQTSIRNLKDNL